MRAKELISILFVALTMTSKGYSQCLSVNLIKNPSLEEYYSCPTSNAQIFLSKYWTQPLPYGYITSDYYNRCYFDQPDSLWDPTLSIFMSKSYFGNGYAAISPTSYRPFNVKYKEYLQGELIDPLQSGSCYYCEYWVRPFYNDYNIACVIDDISVYFSDTLPYISEVQSTEDLLLYFNAQIQNPSGNIISDTSQWTKLSGSFIAQGGERFFTVGSFKQRSEINFHCFYNYFPDNYSYYFFDNFSLCPCSDTLPPEGPAAIVYIPNVFSPNGDGENELFMIRGERLLGAELQVFNRWGNTIFESKDLSTGWDGTYKGQDCAAGVYFYRAVVRFEDGREEEKRGSATLVR